MNSEVLILADPNGKAWDFARSVYEKLNSDPERLVKQSLGEIEIQKFNDGEIFVKVLVSVRKKSCFFVHDSSMAPQDWAMSLAEVNDVLARCSADTIYNVLPYSFYMLSRIFLFLMDVNLQSCFLQIYPNQICL